MSAIPLFHEDGKPAGVWYCSECRTVGPTAEYAERCHGTLACKTCGEPIESSRRSAYNICSECEEKAWRERQAAKEADRFEKAKKITAAEWPGWVYREGCGGEYFREVEDVIERMQDDSEGADPPRYVWAAKDVGVSKVDIDDVVSNILDNGWEDMELSDLNGVAEMEAAIDAFNEANASIEVYLPDYSIAILLDPPNESAKD